MSVTEYEMISDATFDDFTSTSILTEDDDHLKNKTRSRKKKKKLQFPQLTATARKLYKNKSVVQDDTKLTIPLPSLPNSAASGSLTAYEVIHLFDERCPGSSLSNSSDISRYLQSGMKKRNYRKAPKLQQRARAHSSVSTSSESSLPPNDKQARSYLSPGEKLRKIIKCILMIVEVCMELKRYVNAKVKDEKLSLVEMQLKLQADMNKKLPFNPHLYKASHVVNKGSSKLKQLLAIAPEARTKKHIKSIHALVRNKAAFSKHPIHIRMKLCQVMIYQAYEPRRVIIKQGHPPTAFYIILSGTCLINLKTIDDDGEEKVITINEIKEGEVFGEVALLNKTVRTASVVCKDEVELLVIYEQDFDKTVRGPIYKQREEVITFCRKIHILGDWPVNLLLKASFANFQYQYFRKGSIVVKNGLDCNFIVFIKSGECRLISILDNGDNNDWERSILGSIQNVDNNQRASYVGRNSVKLVSIPEKRNGQRIRYSTVDVSPVRLSSMRKSQTRPSIFARKASLHPSGKINYGRRSTLKAEIQIQKKPKRISLDKMSETDPSPIARYLRNTAARPSIVQDTPYAIPKAFMSPYMKKNNQQQDKESSSLSSQNGNLRNFPIPIYSQQSVTTKEAQKPKFAQIAYLKEGSCFGLEELMKRTNLKLTLLSEGSEIVFLSRKLLLRHANGETMRRINSVIGRYPTEEYIRAQLASHGDWDRFRESVVKDVLGRKDEKR